MFKKLSGAGRGFCDLFRATTFLSVIGDESKIGLTVPFARERRVADADEGGEETAVITIARIRRTDTKIPKRSTDMDTLVLPASLLAEEVFSSLPKK